VWENALTAPSLGKVPSEDEESTVQIRHNSHCRKLPQERAKVGMLIVPCRKTLPGKGEAWRLPQFRRYILAFRSPTGIRWGAFYIHSFCKFLRKEDKK
jgi:hypothetical protein